MKQNAPVWRLEPTLSNNDSLDLDFNPYTAKCGQGQILTKFPNFIF